MFKYNRIILDSIEREKTGTDYILNDEDRKTLAELCKEINEYAGTDIQYLAELEALNIHGSGTIIAKYISKFSSETSRGYLIPQLVSDKIKDCDKLVLQLYLHFKASDEYISKPGTPSPAHIYVRYDNAFRKLKPKRLKADLMKLAKNHLDVFYLPLTMRMLASWKVPELEEILLFYLSDNNITEKDVGFQDNCDKCYPLISFINRELRFTAIHGLKYYPSKNTEEIIKRYTTNSDQDVRDAAKKTFEFLLRNNTGT